MFSVLFFNHLPLFYIFAVVIALKQEGTPPDALNDLASLAEECASDEEIVQAQIIHSKSKRKKIVNQEFQESVYTRITPMEIRKMVPSDEMANVLFHRFRLNHNIAYKCKICEKVIKCAHSLNKHMVVHSDHRPYVCELCPNRKYKLEITLKNHIKQKHTNVRDFQCNICGKGFALKVYLKSHLQYHMENKPLKCPYCPKTFVVSAALNTHVNSHIGKRPFACDKCPWRFKNMSGLQSHQLVHTEERPWLCDICSLAFKSKACLQCHRKSQHTSEEHMINCPGCDATFFNMNKLMKHAQQCRGVSTLNLEMPQVTLAQEQSLNLEQQKSVLQSQNPLPQVVLAQEQLSHNPLDQESSIAELPLPEVGGHLSDLQTRIYAHVDTLIAEN